MKTYADPSRAEQSAFCLGAYFGFHGEPIDLIISRAYRDFSRTLHGIGDAPQAEPAARSILRAALFSLSHNEKICDQCSFDRWHRETEGRLQMAFKAEGYAAICVGQTQKWINMALKYVFVYGEQRLPGFDRLYPFCHVPIDNILLGKAEIRDLDEFHCAWSRVNNYDDYLAFQFRVRAKFRGSSPLAVEFHVWAS